ncbi:hypothetical protein M406DRAFT_325280 [Cryphonectria parasitica EP155]|uniref:Xylanolytic transcriptional activator regulatory domain-containing protein n=1 Tax=Cryphonectria parasitica (strain ATCC 38755 / EP155) TaxID=660469 RepID=A0A9P4YBE3_CRYP1|nr:uncharacterized protein M406DRAFT_325280 [Cryphonectria parasitica EP155]KAF3769797.1 hypothetical protein M406DRAFT_325280 [Cryphonectria parasitica EP155]
MAEYQLLAMPSFLALLDAQYAASAAGPAGQPARWGLVNAVLATALRSKIAPGAEAELSVVANAFYRNAISVIQELILQQPSLLSIQALLAMAIFAKDIPDTQAYYMLSTNASRQVESFDISSSTTDPVDFQRYKQVYQIAYMFSADATQRLKNRPMGNNEGGSGGHGV